MRIICEDVSYTFSGQGNEISALDGVNLTAEEQEFLCLVGPSGCGKTTLLRILAGLLVAETGRVMYEGDHPNGRPLNALVFQDHGIFPWMNVLENVAFGLEMRGVTKKQREKESMEFIEKVGLSDFENYYPRELSGGMKQRVGLARAFVQDPEVLLMDEPFAALDAQTRLIMSDELLRIWQEYRKTVVYITHSIDEAVLLGDRVAVMTGRPGKLRKIIPVDLGRPRDPSIRRDHRFQDLQSEIWELVEEEAKKSLLRRVRHE
jgi:NitT/TauT family transport system ATP-binding protein